MQAFAVGEESRQVENLGSNTRSLGRADLRHNVVVLSDLSGSLLAANGLGIDVHAADATLRAQLGLRSGQGLVIASVPEDSIGAKAGLNSHDVILSVDGQDLDDAGSFTGVLDAAKGRTIRLRLLREGKPLDLEATPNQPEVAQVRLTSEVYRVGAVLAEADDPLRAQLELAAGQGLVVTGVEPGGAADLAGVQRNDVLVMLDGRWLTTVEAVNAQIQRIRNRTVALRLLRGGRELRVDIAPRMTRGGATLGGATFRRELTLWDTGSCLHCHDARASSWTHFANPHLSSLGEAIKKAHASLSVVGDVERTQRIGLVPRQQIAALKAQVASLQRTIEALEASLAPENPQDAPQK